MRPPKTAWRPTAGVVLFACAALALPLASEATPLPKPPSASTGGSEQRTYSSASLSATVNPHGVETSFYFQYGTTTGYGAQTPASVVGSGTTPTAVSQAISGLQAGTSYHYRVVAVSAAGTTIGRDRAFSTRSVPMRFELPRTPRLASFGSSLSISGALSGTGGADRQVQLQASQFPFLGGFADLGAPVLTNAEGGFTLPVPALSQNTQLRVVTLDPLPVRSTVVTVHVAPRISIRERATRTPGLVRLLGSVSPPLSGTSVLFQLLRNGSARTVGSATLRGSGRVARFNALVFVKHGLGGLYRAYLKADARFAAASSRGVLVHAAPAPVKTHGRRK